MSVPATLEALLRAQLAEPACIWSLGGYGTAATFARDPGEPVRNPGPDEMGLVTARGAIVLAALQWLSLRRAGLTPQLGFDRSKPELGEIGHLYLPVLLGLIVSAAVVINLKPSRNHCTAAPAVKIAPSSA